MFGIETTWLCQDFEAGLQCREEHNFYLNVADSYRLRICCIKYLQKIKPMRVLDNNGMKLNAECPVGEEDGVYGLILESRDQHIETKIIILPSIILLKDLLIPE